MSLKIEMMVTLMMGTVVQLLVQWKMGISAMVVITLIQTPAPLLFVVMELNLVLRSEMMVTQQTMMVVHLYVQRMFFMYELQELVRQTQEFEPQYVVMGSTHSLLKIETIVILTTTMDDQLLVQ